ncbi:uncharacterized protein METZ01_LOCUS364450, partial [marine metagenome]
VVLLFPSGHFSATEVGPIWCYC